MKANYHSSLFIALLIFLVSCTSQPVRSVWIHPTKAQEEFFQDKIDCLSLVNRVVGQSEQEIVDSSGYIRLAEGYDPFGSFSRGFSDGFNQSSQWMQVYDQALRTKERDRLREEIFNDCMVSKGWHLQKQGQR